ncbi:diaminopimelate epimerase [Labilibaculum sp. A4]|uniref:Diaminopimelate epimerase n=1 Tax=Labilibaculum euxinus TaxID=2686357 RepID=A0A425YEB4_9BACT|nr:diaminopimelate epimerase [Labilibaculum euxinus]MDQ1771990.1 diaminopimelate epimerase [Labilibaculum euxinus]MUP39483.1 diaminopimelate epimerase [Labilibaculum euxinus]MVB08688.1 diaminopimelate epimerase [Labilibaculum euxinus]MWN75660.1 diaminopimelate epimerase [Labilibaculum euxinus]
MKVEFSKYQGTGNDFVLIDNRNGRIAPDDFSLIEKLCDRRFGIGGDGLMLLENADGFDFRMRYYNSDGKEGSMCGNGGRCIVAFAYHLGLVSEKTKFIAVDGEHEAKITNTEDGIQVSLKMIDVLDIEMGDDFYFLNTGSPHFVRFISNHENFDTFAEGKKIRYNNRFAEKGTNVNFVSFQGQNITVSTYERGVEDETYSCGTGVVASAISAGFKTGSNKFIIKTKGGFLEVHFRKISNKQIEDIWLTGPATHVFNGTLTT